MHWHTKISSGYRSRKKFLLPFFSPSLSCHDPMLRLSLSMGRWLCVPKPVVVLGFRVACDELKLLNSLVLTHDVCELISQVMIAACSINLSPMNLKTSGINGINLIYGHRSFPAVFGSPVQGWCDWRWGSPVELIGVGREWEFPARLCWGNWACLAWGRRGLGRPSSSLPWFQGSMGSTEWRKGLNHGANGTWRNLGSDCSIGSCVGRGHLSPHPDGFGRWMRICSRTSE